MKPRDCRPFVGSIKAWLDGELDSKAASELEQHLEVCSGCRSVWEDYGAIAERLRTAGEAVPPAPVLALRGSYERVVAEKKRAIRFLQGVAAAAAAVLVMSTTIALWKESVSAEEKSVRHDNVLEIVLSSAPWEEEY